MRLRRCFTQERGRAATRRAAIFCSFAADVAAAVLMRAVMPLCSRLQAGDASSRLRCYFASGCFAAMRACLMSFRHL